MAETLEQIYVNTSLGSTELDDGEHTILTTDANTRYVIKDVMVKDNTNLSANTYLELNGFNIGSLNGNSSGSLIVPPSSTLKIKTTDYPFSAYEIKYIAGSNTSNTHGLGVLYNYEYTGGISIGSVSSGGKTGSNNPTYHTTTVDAMYTATANDGNSYIHYTTSDANSYQRLMYARTDTTTNSTLQTQNYKAYVISEGSYYGRVVWNNDNTAMSYKDVVSGPTDASSFYNPGTIAGGAKSNSYNPYPTSSYPRGFFGHGYYFYIPDSSYTQYIYGINVYTGSFFSFQVATSHSLTEAYKSFSVGHNPTTDTFTIYRTNAAATVLYDTFSVTKATLDAVSNNSLNAYVSSSNGVITLPTILSTYSTASGILGCDTLGNLTYKTSTNVLTTVNTSGTVINEESSITIDGTTFLPDNSSIFNKRTRKLTSAEATSLGINGPTFGVQILGVKSVV